MKTLSLRFAIPVAALFSVGCSAHQPSPIPTQPSVVLQPPAPPLVPTPQPAGRPIAVGEVVSATITSDGASCEYRDPGEFHEELVGDCQRFVVAVPGDGTLNVRVAWGGGSDFYFLGIESHFYACCESPLLARVPVKRGSSYTLDVVRSRLTVGGTRSVPFELTTSLDRN